jgi:UPF0716 family protein affecting phage T7 exclusion
MRIEWSALAGVAVVSFAAGVTIVVIFSVGVLASSQGPRSTDDKPESRTSGGVLATAAAGLCFLACALIVCYGIYLVVPQFH